MEYNAKNIKVVKFEKKEGVFETEGGNNITYTNYYVYFTIGDYPLVFKAKVDKVLKDYLSETELEPVADSDNGSAF